MFREIDSTVFRTQTMGRIVRTAVHDDRLFGYPQLRTGYLYTTYAKNEVEAKDPETGNKPKVNVTHVSESLRKEGAKANIQAEMAEILGGEDGEPAAKTLADGVAAIWEEHGAALDGEESGEAQKSIAGAIVELAEREGGKALTDDAKRQIADSVQANAEIHRGEREGALVLDPMLKSDYESRAAYGDLGKTSEFQKSFIDSMDKWFGLGEYKTGSESDEELLRAKGVDTEVSLKQDVMVGAKFAYEYENEEEGTNEKVEVSRNDAASLFTLACFNILKDTDIGNIARSWSVLREGLRQWYRTLTVWTGDDSFDPFYRIAVKDFRKDTNSELKKAVLGAIEDYKPVLDAFVREREQAARRQSQPFAILTSSAYTDDFEVYAPAAKSMRRPFYLRKEYAGRDNETKFIEHLEGNPDVKAWLKNADAGVEALSIRYRSEADGKFHLFNPDWLVVHANGDIGIYDTKGGQTSLAQSPETQAKCAALMERIAWLNAHSSKHYRGGIYEYEGGLWKLKCG